MALTPAQLLQLRNDIAADGALNPLPKTPDTALQIAAAYNAIASPDYWVWRTSVSQLEIVTATTADGTVWSWPAFIARSQGERDGWREMFADGGSVNASLANVRQGFADIFSGSTNNAPAQRTHLLTVGRRKATRAEKLFATGAGTTAAPSLLGFEGDVTGQDVDSARAN
jgi:hypothetical protein